MRDIRPTYHKDKDALKEKELHKDKDYYRIRELEAHREKNPYQKPDKLADDTGLKKRTREYSSKDLYRDETGHDNTKKLKKSYDESTNSRSFYTETLDHHKERIPREESVKDERKLERKTSGGVEVSLPPNWKAAWSKDGDIYYYNTVSGERTWTMPGDHKDKPKEGTHNEKHQHKSSKDKQAEKEKEKRERDEKSSKERADENRDTKLRTDEPERKAVKHKSILEKTGEPEKRNLETEEPKKDKLMDNESAGQQKELPEPQNEKDMDKADKKPEHSASNLIAGQSANNNSELDSLTHQTLEPQMHGGESQDTDIDMEPTFEPKPRQTTLQRDLERVLERTPINFSLLRPEVQQSLHNLGLKSRPTTPVSPIQQSPPSTSTPPTPTTGTLPTISSSRCIRCSPLPTIPQLSKALQDNLANFCCARCEKRLVCLPCRFTHRFISITDSFRKKTGLGHQWHNCTFHPTCTQAKRMWRFGSLSITPTPRY